MYLLDCALPTRVPNHGLSVSPSPPECANSCCQGFSAFDDPVIRNANRGDSRESIRRKKPIFITCERFARIASNLQFAIFSPPPPPRSLSALPKNGVHFGKPETIREQQANRTNLRIDSRDSDHLSFPHSGRQECDNFSFWLKRLQQPRGISMCSLIRCDTESYVRSSLPETLPTPNQALFIRIPIRPPTPTSDDLSSDSGWEK